MESGEWKNSTLMDKNMHIWNGNLEEKKGFWRGKIREAGLGGLEGVSPASLEDDPEEEVRLRKDLAEIVDLWRNFLPELDAIFCV